MTRVYAKWLAIFSEESRNCSCWTNPGFCLYGMSVNETSGSDCICLFNVISIFSLRIPYPCPMYSSFIHHLSTLTVPRSQPSRPLQTVWFHFFLFQQHKAFNYCFPHKHGYIEPRSAGWAHPWRKLTLHPQKLG